MYFLADYRCDRCGEVFESLEPRSSAPPHPSHPCGGVGERVLSAVLVRQKLGEVTRGKNGPPPEHALDTRPMAEGVPMHEWRQESRAKRRQIIRRHGA